MNKIAIVGHPSADLHRIEAWLQRCGMHPAQPSRREGLSPQAISDALLKAHQCAPVAEVTDESLLAPLQVGPVWQALALDLLLGNVEQPFWGWSDPNTLYLLDYWHALEPQLLFVLVYEPPQAPLLRLAQAYEGEGAFAAATTQAVANWQAYNGALLRFYLRHPNRCVLVGAEQLTPSASDLLEVLAQKLQRPLVPPAHAEGAPPGVAPPAEPDNCLLSAVLAGMPQAVQLHAELQSASTLPLAAHPTKPDPLQAMEALLRERHTRNKAAPAPVAADPTKLAELQEESDLLLIQLHQVQEELERYYLENQSLKQGAPQKPAKPRLYGAGDRIKRQLTYRLGARVIAQAGTFWGKVFMLPALWQEALAFRRDKAARAAEKLPPIGQYADANEAERAKQHLAYRLGLVVRRTGYNPLKWPLLPMALQAEVRAWEREKGRA